MNENLLSRYLDGELSPDEVERLEQALQRDPALRRRLAELRSVSHATKLAMQAPEMSNLKTNSVCEKLSRSGLRLATAASVVLAIGISIGFVFHTNSASGPAAILPQGNAVIRPEHAQVVGDVRAIVHVSTADSGRFRATLDDLETLLERYKKENEHLQLEVIANGPALDLYRVDKSPASERIRQLQANYGNLTFLACRKTLERLKKEQGVEVKLVPGVKVAPSALEQILMRLQNGWTYIQA